MSLTWEAPQKGEWRGLHDHFPRSLTPEYQGLLVEGMTEGQADYFARYGLPGATMRPEFVHGRVFINVEPLVGGFSDRVPPAPALWLAVRVVPAFRRRAAAARRALDERIWLDEAAHWYATERVTWEERNRELTAVDPPSLDDAALVDHLRTVRAHAADGYRRHFRLHGTDLLPTALYLTRSGDFGVDAATATALLAGSSPASTGAATLPEWALVTGYDLDEKAACELPVRHPRRAATAEPPDGLEDDVRARVPTSHRAEWEQLLADARATYGVRDDNGLLTAAWPVGLVRRAMLAAGERLVGRSRLDRREHAVECTIDELVAALRDDPEAVTAADVAERAARRAELSSHPAPPILGPETELPLGALPAAMQLMTRSLITLRDLSVTPLEDRQALRGTGIGDRPVTGRACVAADPAEALERFVPGDIVVTAGTTPAWNTVLALAGGIVVEEGGPLSHAAVIARELGLTAIVGSADAVALVADGATIELDPVAGTVRVVS